MEGRDKSNPNVTDKVEETKPRVKRGTTVIRKNPQQAPIKPLILTKKDGIWTSNAAKMPASRPRGSSAHSGARVATAPMSERQQMALVMQLTSQTNQQAVSSTSHNVTKSRDRNERGETALHVGAIKGDHEQVKKLIDQGMNPNVADFAGWTPLHEACSHGWHNIAIILIQAGANVNARGLDDDTPLHDAANNGQLKLVKYLIECGADPYFKNKKGKMPFDVASPPALEYLASLKESTTSQRITHTGKSRDDSKKSSTGVESTSSSGCKSAIMDSVNKSNDDKNETKEPTSSSVDKTFPNQVIQKNIEDESNSGSASVAVVSSTQDDAALAAANQGNKRNFTEISDTPEPESNEEEGGVKRKKRKDSDSSKETTKANQQARVTVGRNSHISGSKPPGPASKTGVAPLNKGSGATQGTGSKSGNNNNAQSKAGSGTHGQGVSKSVGSANAKGNVTSSQNTSQSNKLGSGNQGKAQSSNLSVSQSGKGLTDKKSPCASPKPLAFSQNKDDAEDDSKTVDTPGPKVPPLKIVIPGGVGGAGGSGNQQEGEGGSTQRGSTKNRGNSSTLPYILQTSNTSSDTISSNADGNDSNFENTKDEKRLSNSVEEKAGVSGQRVLRSHRNADGAEKDKDRGRHSPHVSQSAICSSSSSSSSAKSSNQQAVDIDSNNSGNVASTSGSNSGSSSGASTSTAGTSSSSSSPAVWDGVFQVPSVDFHPRKRKIKSSKESHSHHQSQPDSSSHSSSSSGESHTLNINPQSNSYQMHINVKKQIERRLKSLFPVQPKPPQGFKDYLMNRCTYVLKSNAKQQPILKPPQTLPLQMREEFVLQENERHYLRVQHLVEKEKLVLAVEQEILRVHGRAARALANQSLPFSVCSVLREKEVYNMQTPEQEEKERNAQRSRYNGRLFLSWLQDVDDKWEKIKEAMVKRHHTEAQSLYASQSMSWMWRLKELGLCDHKASPLVDQGHVPRVNVSDDFDLLPA